MFKTIIVLITAIIGFHSNTSYSAITCAGCFNQTVNTDITRSMTSNENTIGKIIPSNDVVTGTFDFKVNVNQRVYMNEWFVYAGEAILNAGLHNTTWNFHKVDDYVSVALRYVNNCGVEHYAPFNAEVLTQGVCTHHSLYENIKSQIWYPRTFQTAIRIDKRIVSGTYTRNIFVGEYGVCMNAAGNCQSKDYVFTRVFANFNVTVPQSCELNAGQVINIDFGNISSGAFKIARANAQGVQPQSREISVKCDNIAGNAQLTLRLQADKYNGDIVVSDESDDIGFRVTNNSGTPLIPNNIDNFIPFTLDNNARQNVTIKVFPASVTGNKPAEGPVTSRAYLRVDFP